MADVPDSILKDKKADTPAGATKVDFGNIFEQPKLNAAKTEGAAPKVVTGDGTGSAKAPGEAPALVAKEPVKEPKKDAPAPVKETVVPAKEASDKLATPVDLTKPLSPELQKGLALSNEVARILDNDVPTANRARKMPEAEAAYNKAIEVAKQVTPEQIAAAKADYEAVLKAKATETDPEKLLALQKRQAADYTLMRVNDCAHGNKALWLYRQGRVQEGTAEYLQAAGVSPEESKTLSSMNSEQKDRLGEKLNANAAILSDVNFMNQYKRIMESGQKLPIEFVQMHEFLMQQKEKLARANDGVPKPEVAAKDASPEETQKARVETIQRLGPNEQANIAAINAGSELAKQLADAGTKTLTPEQNKVLADSVKAADDNLTLAKAKFEFSAIELGKLVPAEKAEAFTAAVSKIDAEFTKVVAGSPAGPDGKPALSAADAGMLQTITNINLSAADRTAALTKLGEAHPAFGKAVTDAIAIVGNQESGLDAISLQFGMTGLSQNYESALYAQPIAHYNYAALLHSVGGPENDAAAKKVLEGSFANLPPEVTQKLVGDPVVAKLASDVKATLPVVTPDASANPAKVDDSTPLPGQVTDAAAVPGATVIPGVTAEMAAMLAKAPNDQLIAAARALAKEGPDSILKTKATYEQLLKNIDDPAVKAEQTQRLTASIAALEKNQTLDGKPLDAATRIKMHLDNAKLIDAMSYSVTVRQEYAAYLGGKDASSIDTKKPENLQPMLGFGPNQMDLNKSMDEQLKLIYKAADAMPIALMQREKANLEKSLAEIGSEDTDGVIAASLDFLQGNKEKAGAIDIGVTTRTASAMMYISQGAYQDPETKVWKHRDDPKIDILYQPTKAVELLKEADAKYKEIHGANATDPMLDQVKAFGAQLAPAEFAKVTTAANTRMWSTGVDMLDTGLSFATQLGVAALLSKTKIGFAGKHLIADAATFGVNASTRAVVMRLGTGQWEPLGDTAVHAAGVTALVSTMKYGSIYGNRLLSRNMAGYESVAMSARSMDNAVGKTLTLNDYGAALMAKGMNSEALMIRNSGLGARKIADLTDAELRAVLPATQAETMAAYSRTWQKNYAQEATLADYGRFLEKRGLKIPDLAAHKDGARKLAELTDDQIRAALPSTLSNRGAEAMYLIEGSMTKELQALNELRKVGINTYGDLKGAVTKDLTASQEFVAAAKSLPGYEKMTPRQAMEQLGIAGNTRFNTAAKITDELAALDNGMRVSRFGKTEAITLPKVGPVGGKSIGLPTRDVKNMGDLERYVAKATPESEFQRLFPNLAEDTQFMSTANMTPGSIYESSAGMFGKVSRRGADGQGWRTIDRLAPEAENIAARRTFGQWAKETFVTNRFYGGLSIPKTARADLADVQALKGAMNRRADAVAVGSYVVGLHAYESITGVYDRLGKGVDEEGKPKKYNFSEALLEANFGSTNPTAMDVVRRSGVLEGLFAGAAFRGFSKLGMAQTSELGVKQILRQNLSPNALKYQALSSPLSIPFVTNGIEQYKLAPMVKGADQPLTDYDYGLGLAVDPNAPAEVPAEKKTPVPAVPPVVDDNAAKENKAAPAELPKTGADAVSSPDASP